LPRRPPTSPLFPYTTLFRSYLAGRAHYQLVAYLRTLLQNHQLDEHAFFVLSVLSIQDNLTLKEINHFVAYTGREVSISMLLFLQKQGYIVADEQSGEQRFLLTGEGREVSLEHVALAKAVEEEVTEKLGVGDTQALKFLLKRLIQATDPGLPDLWTLDGPADQQPNA